MRPKRRSAPDPAPGADAPRSSISASAVATIHPPARARVAIPGRLASFRIAILLLFLVPMVVTVMAIVYKMSERAESVVDRLSSQIIEQMGEQVLERAAGLVHVAEAHLLANAAVAATTPIIAGQAMFADLFWQQVVFTPELTGLYIGDRDGSFVQARTEPEPATRVIDRTRAPPTERLVVRDLGYRPIAHLERDAAYDPRARPWYRQTQPERRLQWSDVYRFQGSGRLGITATYPLLDDAGRILAVLGADATLDAISDLISRRALGPRSAAFILDDRDRLIAFPRHLEIAPDPADADGLATVSAVDLPWVANALAAIPRPGAGPADRSVHRSVTKGQTSLTHVIELGDRFALPWRLVIVLSEADLLSDARRSLQESIVVSAIIVILALFVVYPLAASFAESVEQLTRNTRLLRLFRPAEVVPVKSVFREIREMDEAIGGLRETLTFVEGQIPTEVIRQLASGAARIELRAELKTLAVMASALDDLDALFVAQRPEQVVDFLARQVEHGSAIIKREHGTLDAFRGDRIHAFWDVPAAPDQAARNACRAALALARACALDAADQGACGAVTRWSGLHLGRGLVGNLGVAGRLRAAAMGRLVGVAARLRDANARYGTRVIISEAVYLKVRDQLRCRLLDALTLPGDTRATLIYELRGEAGDGEETGFIRLCELGFELYRARAWGDAIATYRSALMYAPDDIACVRMIARCESLRDGAAAALPEDWDGAAPDAWL